MRADTTVILRGRSVCIRCPHTLSQTDCSHTGMPERPLRTLVLAALAIPLLWCFGALLTAPRVCAYRDTASFYYPLYHWTSACWSRGEVPLWNPQDNLGTPVAAEATSAVFYPLQLLLVLPGPYWLKFNAYLIGHFVLACAGMWLMARRMLSGARDQVAAPLVQRGADRSIHDLAAALAAIAYAFGGATLFQYCNVVFLIGAAWLPWALLAADHMLAERRWRWVAAAAACLALMVLGGDPQMAYHAGLAMALLAWFRRRNSHNAGNEPPHAAPGWSRHALTLLAVTAGLAMLLSAVQIVPAVALTRQSHRAVQDSRGAWARFAGPPLPDTHAQQLYDFSVAPWRMVECVWPNGSGHMFPRNQRWLTAVRAEDRVWTPTLYFGLLPLIAAVLAWRARARYASIGWLLLILLAAVGASFGSYGLGSLARTLQSMGTGQESTLPVGDATGGLYWLMTKVLPGYAFFRYPAKLLVVASFAASLLAACGLVHLLTRDRALLRRSLTLLGGASVLVGALVALSGPWWNEWLAQAPRDELFGPLDVSGAWAGCLIACAHTLLLSALYRWLVGRCRSPLALCRVLVLLTACEIAWANGSHVMTAPVELMRTATVLDQQQRELELTDQASAPIHRIYRPPFRRWAPHTFRQAHNRRRGAESLRWDHATLMPKYHLLTCFGSVHSINTMRNREYQVLLRLGGGRAPTRGS